ncbi:MAG: hypothetical protein ACM3UZ_16730 [Acidobacteriota bacterium]
MVKAIIISILFIIFTVALIVLANKGFISSKKAARKTLDTHESLKVESLPEVGANLIFLVDDNESIKDIVIEETPMTRLPELKPQFKQTSGFCFKSKEEFLYTFRVMPYVPKA